MQAQGIAVAVLLALVPACGGGDPAVDATPPIDSPPPPPDACVESGSCGAAACDDVTGSYATCATCPIVGTVGPFATTVTQCGCTLDGCIDNQCGMGCVDGSNVTWTAMVSGTTLTCTGAASGGTATFNCTSGLGNCTASWLAPNTTACP